MLIINIISLVALVCIKTLYKIKSKNKTKGPNVGLFRSRPIPYMYAERSKDREGEKVLSGEATSEKNIQQVHNFTSSYD